MSIQTKTVRPAAAGPGDVLASKLEALFTYFKIYLNIFFVKRKHDFPETNDEAVFKTLQRFIETFSNFSNDSAQSG